MKIYLASVLGKKKLYESILSRSNKQAVSILWGGQRNDENILSRWHQRKSERPLEILNGGGYENLLSGRASSEKWQICSRGGQILESFYYARKNEYIEKLIPTLDGFLLDSGAFSFMQGKEAESWDEYTEEYADYIKRNNIELFFELDIDSIVGLKEVERLRKKLQELTGKYPIPVWHKNRGLDYFKKMCKEYPYAALGGIAIKEIPTNIFSKVFPYFISEAHKAGVKIHGLGYTSLEGLYKYHFDSVDSTAWLYGNRGGYLYLFDETTGKMGKYKPDGKRLLSHESALHNYQEWCKFQKYAERNL